VKTCSKCYIEKELDYFYKKKQNADGYHKTCQECMKNQRRMKYREIRNKTFSREDVLHKINCLENEISELKATLS
jgi:chromosome segregation ATPase